MPWIDYLMPFICYLMTENDMSWPIIFKIPLKTIPSFFKNDDVRNIARRISTTFRRASFPSLQIRQNAQNSPIYQISKFSKMSFRPVVLG